MIQALQRPLSVAHIGNGHGQGLGEPIGVNRQMPFDSSDLRSRIISCFCCRISVFDALGAIIMKWVVPFLPFFVRSDSTISLTLYRVVMVCLSRLLFSLSSSIRVRFSIVDIHGEGLSTDSLFLTRRSARSRHRRDHRFGDVFFFSLIPVLV